MKINYLNNKEILEKIAKKFNVEKYIAVKIHLVLIHNQNFINTILFYQL